MTWIRLDDNFFTHPKIARLSPEAKCLHLAALCYSSQHLTDGLISSEVISILLRKNSHRALISLTSAGLWHRTQKDQFQIHDYLDYQTSRAQVEKIKETTRKRVEKHRNKKLGISDGNADVTPLLGVGNAHVTQPEPEPPTEPEPYKYLVQHSVGQEVLDLCNLLADCVEANLKEKSKNPQKVKRPEISEAWISQMDLLIRKDGHSVEEVKEIIGWTQADEFWSSNVMSPAKLRKQFDQLILKKPKGPVKPKAIPHHKLDDPNGAYCGSCHQSWPCTSESKKSENLF